MPPKKKLSTIDEETTYFSDISDVESLLSQDELLPAEEGILGSNFNIPFEGRFIQGNRIHRELAATENTYKRLFIEHRSSQVHNSSPIKSRVTQYLESEVNIQEAAEEAQANIDIPIESRYGLFSLLADKRPPEEQFKEVQKRRNDELHDKWNDHKAYPNIAIARISYIGIDGKLHTKAVKSNKLSGNGHPEAQVLEYVEKLLQTEAKYLTTEKIIVDIHTKLDMCAVKPDKSTSGTCTKIARDLTTKYPKLAVRVSFDVEHYYGQGSYNYLCQPCKPTSYWSDNTPTNYMLQEPIVGKIESEYLDLSQILISEGGLSAYYATIESVKKAHHQFIINAFNERFAANQQALQAVNVEDDGNCFFRAVARQLLEGQGQFRDEYHNYWIHIFNPDEIPSEDILQICLRTVAVNNMQERHNENPAELPNDAFVGGFNNYINRMTQSEEWADHHVIEALARVLKVNIYIYRDDGRITHIRPPQAFNTVIRLAYTGAHYMSVENIADQIDGQIESITHGAQAIAIDESTNTPTKPSPSSASTSMPTSSPTFTHDLIKNDIDELTLTDIEERNKQTLNTIEKIETVIGKQALAELAGWHQYLSKSLSNNPLSEYARTMIQTIGNLFSSLEELLDSGIAYEDTDLNNKITIIIAQLEGMFDFVASDSTHIGLPPIYPHFDPDDYSCGGGTGSNNSSDNSLEEATFISFSGNSTTYDD